MSTQIRNDAPGLPSEVREQLVEKLRGAGTQKAVSSALGISVPTLQRIIAGTAPIDLDLVYRIGGLVELPVSHLLFSRAPVEAVEGRMPLPIPERIAKAQGGDKIAIRELDLTFGMGATYLDLPVTERVHEFPRDWIRIYTKANPEKLFFAQGVGDSMASTILDSDLLLVDCSQQHLNMGDKIWAISCGDVGMVKRLRPNPGGSVTVLSDNPLVPSFDVVDGEMSILGRVVAIVRKM